MVKQQYDDVYWMQKALDLAILGQYTTRPNPCVGCVIVKDNKCIGTGWHQVAGGPHAEVYALREASENANGATCYVTLEPCAHYGRTPPCCEALVKAGVKRVVIAASDPNPFVNGSGENYLLKNGIKVTTGILKKQAEKINRGFLKRMREGRPWLTLKLGMTLDGKIADFDGNSQWITSQKSRQDVQALRARHDAILSTARTVMRDGARLTVRILPDDFPKNTSLSFKQPLRVVIDRQAVLPETAAIFDQNDPVLIYSAKKRDKTFNESVDQHVISQNGSVLNFEEILDDLGRRGISSVLVEAGGTLAGSILSQGLVDELVVYLAPSILGQTAKAGWVLPEALSLNQKYNMYFDRVQTLGNDIKIEAYYREAS